MTSESVLIAFPYFGLNSPLIKSICYERLHSTQASFSTENDLNVASGHDFGHFRSRALPASNSLVLATTDFINGLLRQVLPAG